MHAFQRTCQDLDMICTGSGDNEPEGHLGLPFNCVDGPISLRVRLGQAGPNLSFCYSRVLILHACRPSVRPVHRCSLSGLPL